MVPQLRAATLEDAPDLRRLADELGYPVTEDEMRSRLGELLPRGEHGLFVAQDAGGPLVGWVHVHIRRSALRAPEALLAALVVTSSHRGSGLGRELVLRAEEWTRQQGLSRIRLRSRQERTEAHRFYRRLGYLEEKRQVVFHRSLGGGEELKPSAGIPGPNSHQRD